MALIFFWPIASFAQGIRVENDKANKKVSFGNAKMTLVLDYDHKANISQLTLNGEIVIDGPAGIFTEIRTKSATYSALHLAVDPVVKVNNNIITISDISYGDKDIAVQEVWRFLIASDNIKVEIERTLPKYIIVEEAALPKFIFSSINTWEGAYQDYGGLAWFYLFNKKQDTYGVHSRSSQFWNSKTGNGLSFSVDAPGKEVAMTYSRTDLDQLAFSSVASASQMTPRFDSGTNRRRYIQDRTDVWSPFKIAPGKTIQRFTLSYFDFSERYGRGKMAGINGNQVNAVLNTIARIGVIDKQHFGGNSWHTPYGPICLHEQYIAQMGLGIDDTSYLKGYQECLDYYRDNAIRPDGHVWPRWAYTNEDMMPGQVTDKGFYEARWGYLLDANPDLVTNVAELYDLTGNRAWVKTHQRSCEKALDWILKRDFNNNGLVEMINDSHTQKKGSDWIDIIWSSYENAFVNAKLYHALILWAAIERQLGSPDKERYYNEFAQKLKAQFNKPVAEGGFWDNENNCYIHWREKDGSIHGTNTVTPVNFMAVGYGICDNEQRRNAILDNIETQMEKENLFFWPLCLYSYKTGEGNDWQFPFPNYENGDIFLSWGALGVKAYASYKPELAVKYIKNVLQQYSKDGLAFQRYGRAKQDGLGDDILSGNSLSIIGLFQAVYGINPLYNRLYLDPHITSELSGTKLIYNFRGQNLAIDLTVGEYKISNGQFAITSKKPFGFFGSSKQLLYFDGNEANASLKASVSQKCKLSVGINNWDRNKLSWSQSSATGLPGKVVYHINNLIPNMHFSILVNDRMIRRVKSAPDGSLSFDCETSQKAENIVVSVM